MMSITEMMNMMDKKLEAEKYNEEAKAETERTQVMIMAKGLVNQYGKRIDEIIKLLQYCDNRGIEFPNEVFDNYNKLNFEVGNKFNDFESDGIRHQFGGMKKKGENKITHLGWCGGGAFGNYDMLVNGRGITMICTDGSVGRMFGTPTKEDILRFEREFIEFECMVTKWFEDKLR